jgi:hypothetical protein
MKLDSNYNNCIQVYFTPILLLSFFWLFILTAPAFKRVEETIVLVSVNESSKKRGMECC